MSGDAGLDRRTLLKRGGLLLLGATLPLPLAACGKTTHVEVERSIAFIYAGGEVSEPYMPLNPPLGDFARLIDERARQSEVSVAVSSEEPRATLRGYVEPGEIDPATGGRPPEYPVVVVSVPGITLDPTVVKAVEGGVQLISFLFPVPHSSASITVDPARMGTMLAEDILVWSQGQVAGGEVLLVDRKPPSPYATVPFTGTESDSGAALRSALAAASPAVRVLSATVANEDSEDGIRAEHVVRETLASNPAVRTVACLDDSAALGAARALAAAHPKEAARLYVGGLGVPSASSRMTLEALEGPGCLRTLVAVSPRTLADALVDVSVAPLESETAEDVAVPPLLLRRGSAALRRYARDYTPHGYIGLNEGQRFFVLNPPSKQPGVPTGPRRSS
jgi:hypothetical protein